MKYQLALNLSFNSNVVDISFYVHFVEASHLHVLDWVLTYEVDPSLIAMQANIHCLGV